MAEEEVTEVVADNGSGMCADGFAGDVFLRAVIPSTVDKPKMPGIVVCMEQKDSYVGEEVQSKRGVPTVKHLIQHEGNRSGIVVCASVIFLFLMLSVLLVQNSLHYGRERRLCR